MENKNFAEHLTTPISDDEIKKSLDKNKINIYRSNHIYLRFCLLLSKYVTETYFGCNYFKSTHDKEQHLKWCFNKTSSILSKEGIDFTLNKELFDYFFDMFDANIYLISENDYNEKLIYKTYVDNWKYIFNSIYMKNIKKHNYDLEVYLDIYSLFEKTYDRN
jgi:hypothetical protein